MPVLCLCSPVLGLLYSAFLFVCFWIFCKLFFFYVQWCLAYMYVCVNVLEILDMLSFLKEHLSDVFSIELTCWVLDIVFYGSYYMYTVWSGIFMAGSRQYNFSRVTQSKGSKCPVIFCSKETAACNLWRTLEFVFIWCWHVFSFLVCLFVLFFLLLQNKVMHKMRTSTATD